LKPGLLALALAGLLLAAPSEARRLALLVGVGDYGAAQVNDLQGPPFDVRALREVLLQRWHFAPQDVRTLLDAQATRAGILAALDRLNADAAPGDELFIYFSGHGTSAWQPGSTLPLPYSSGGFVPYDFLLQKPATPQAVVGQLIVGESDLRPRIDAMERAGRRLFVVSDSCFSGQAVRAAAARGAEPEGLVLRYQPWPDERGATLKQPQAEPAPAAQRPPPEPYPYHQTFYLAAASDSEPAADISGAALLAMPTLDGLPHGALTDALLRVLSRRLPADFNQDGSLSFSEVYIAVKDFMASRRLRHTPQRLPSVAEDRFQIARGPVFGLDPAAGTPANGGLQDGASLSFAPAAVSAPAELADPLLRVSAQGLPPAVVASWQALPGLQWQAAEPDVLLVAGPQDWALTRRGGDVMRLFRIGDQAAVALALQHAAWAHALHARAEAGRRGALELGFDPDSRGGSFVVGERLKIVLKPERAAVLMLISLDSLGRLTTLYPAKAAELAAAAAGEVQQLPPGPRQYIRVREPQGIDQLFAFAFDSAPPELPGLMAMDETELSDPRVQGLRKMLVAWRGRYDYARQDLRTLPADPPKTNP